VPGTRQFDESQVHDAMMRVFWQKGYVATTIDDLVQATGLKRGSLYHAFGDKAGMFCRTLALYRQEVQATLLPCAMRRRPQAALTRYCRLLAQAANKPERPKGWMIDDLQRCCERLPETAARGTKAAIAMETACSTSSCGHGELLAPTADCRALARFYAALSRGVTGSEPDPNEDVARIGVGLLRAA
jgi:AcrR family transcriptional regulator